MYTTLPLPTTGMTVTRACGAGRINFSADYSSEVRSAGCAHPARPEGASCRGCIARAASAPARPRRPWDAARIRPVVAPDQCSEEFISAFCISDSAGQHDGKRSAQRARAPAQCRTMQMPLPPINRRPHTSQSPPPSSTFATDARSALRRGLQQLDPQGSHHQQQSHHQLQQHQHQSPQHPQLPQYHPQAPPQRRCDGAATTSDPYQLLPGRVKYLSQRPPNVRVRQQPPQALHGAVLRDCLQQVQQDQQQLQWEEEVRFTEAAPHRFDTHSIARQQPPRRPSPQRPFFEGLVVVEGPNDARAVQAAADVQVNIGTRCYNSNAGSIFQCFAAKSWYIHLLP